MIGDMNNNDNDDIIIESKDMLIEKLCIKMKEDMIDSINNDDYVRVFQFLGVLNQAQQNNNSLNKDEKLIFEKLIPMLGNSINISFTIITFILMLYINIILIRLLFF
jgi:hypothetical protein